MAFVYTLAIYVMVNERKCLHKELAKPDTLVFTYNTSAIASEGHKEIVTLMYKFEIMGDNGKPLKGGQIEGFGKAEVLVTAGTYRLCLEHINNPNYKISPRQLARQTKRIDVRFEAASEIEEQPTEKPDSELYQVEHLLVKTKAIASQQSGSEYRRTSTEKSGRSIRIHSRIVTLLSCFCYILMSYLMVKLLKRHFKQSRL